MSSLFLSIIVIIIHDRIVHDRFHPFSCAHTARLHAHIEREFLCVTSMMHGFIFTHIRGVWQQGAYLVSILHALKYPSNSVNGVLVHIMKFTHTLYLQTGTHARTHTRTHAPRTRARAHTHTHEPMLARIMCGMIVCAFVYTIFVHTQTQTHTSPDHLIPSEVCSSALSIKTACT